MLSTDSITETQAATIAASLWGGAGAILLLLIGAGIRHAFGRWHDQQKSLDESRASCQAIAGRIHGELERLEGLVDREELRRRPVPRDAYAARYENLRAYCSDLDAAIAAKNDEEWRWLSFSLSRLLSSAEELTQEGVMLSPPDLTAIQEIVAAIRAVLPVLEEPVLPESLAIRRGQEQRALAAAAHDAKEQDRVHLLACRDARPDLFQILRDGYMIDVHLGGQRLRWLLDDSDSTDPTIVPACVGALADLVRQLRLPDAELLRVRECVFALLSQAEGDIQSMLVAEIRDRGGLSFGALLLSLESWDPLPFRALIETSFIETVEARANNGWTLLHDDQLRVVLRVWHTLSATSATAYAELQLEARDPKQRARFLDAFVVPLETDAGLRLSFDLEVVELLLDTAKVRAALENLANSSVAPQARHILRAFRDAFAAHGEPSTADPSRPAAET